MTDVPQQPAPKLTQWPSGTLRIVDLSVVVSEHLPAAWPGSMHFVHKVWNWFTEHHPVTGARNHCAGPYATNFMIIDEHTGTHLDGPSHFIPPPDSGLPHAGPLGLQTGELLDLADMCGDAAVIDVSFLSSQADPGRSPEITPAHLEEWESVNGPIDVPVVLLRTGWDRYYVDGPEGQQYLHRPLVTKDAPGWPAPTAEAMLLLHGRGVRLCGTDGASMGSCHDGGPVHWAGLGSGMLFVEVLCNLSALPTRGAFFQFLPIKVAGSTGGPGRAVAYLPQAG